MVLSGFITIGAEGAVVRREGTIARISVVLLHTLPSIAALHHVAAAVALAPWVHPRGVSGLVFQVKGHAVDPQGPHAAQETPLSP